MSEMFKSKEEIVQLRRDHGFLSAFLYFGGPHRTIYMDKLVYLEWDESACNSLFP